jgi:hypothetical protein
MVALYGILAGILPALSAYPYIRDILKHKTKPHRAAFLIWAVLGAIAFFTQLAKGATWSLLLPLGDTLSIIVIFVLAIRYGAGGFNKKDVGALALASLGLIVWYFTRQPLTALLIIIAIDVIGVILTLQKSYQEPHEETSSAWLLASLGAVFAMLAVNKLSFSLLVYLAYIFLTNGAIFVAVILGLRRTQTPHS